MAIFGLLESSGPYTVVYGPWAVGRVQGDHKLAQSPRHPPLWPGPIDGVQGHQDHGLPKDAGEAHSDECSPKGALNLHS
ncbi:hypothetical protein O181_126261 [Austropuccinia psidii MF-1]|uniref:Uncharacterized protein n=1 Tax=Austropuccinia psidii MF-1 TaxID=1389203 RepID=A0A9Q3KTY9_9BASI|nr:hypothetical protein [Austropuccinia psidii MF-1]